MEAAISEQVGDTQPEEVMELSLDSCLSVDLKKLSSYTALRSLSLCNNDLVSIHELPVMNELVMLDLSENKFSEGFDCIVEKFKNLTYLNLSKNDIDDVEKLKCLSKLKYLESLHLEENPITDDDDYRDVLFPLFECLISIDGFDIHGNEIDSSESEFDDDDDDNSDEEASDTGLEVLLGEDIPSELDDSEFQMDDSALKEAQSLNEQSVEENGVQAELSVSVSKSTSEEVAEKRSFSEEATPSPSKKPKV